MRKKSAKKVWKEGRKVGGGVVVFPLWERGEKNCSNWNKGLMFDTGGVRAGFGCAGGEKKGGALVVYNQLGRGGRPTNSGRPGVGYDHPVRRTRRGESVEFAVGKKKEEAGGCLLERAIER